MHFVEKEKRETFFLVFLVAKRCIGNIMFYVAGNDFI